MSSRYQNIGGMSCNDYLVLNPEKASLFDLIRLLVSEDLVEGKDFLERPQGLAAADEHLKRLRYRWIVFISIVLQKIFLLLRNPVAACGSSLQVWLNLVFVNGGLLKLFFNKIRGNVVRPRESWDESRSVTGYVDVRDDLDRNIKPDDDDDDERFVVHLSLMASKLSYENSAHVQHVVTNIWQMKFLHFYDFWNAFLGDFTTQAFVFQTSTDDPDLVIVSFRGTEPFNLIDWCTDVDISWYGLDGVGKLHGGFMKALGLDKNMDWPKEPNNTDGPSAYLTLRQILREKARENANAKFILTGHSLGGALAVLFAGMLIVHDETEILRRFRGVYTFGQPRVGDAEFGQYMMEKLKSHNVTYRRFVYCNDVVPRLPYDDKMFFFKHFGECFFYDGFYRGKVVKEEPNRNYFSLLWVIPKYLNAYWELMRGQTMLPLMNGRLYGEWFGLVLLRLIGLMIPGLAAHGLQDYDNITRLGNTRLLPESASGSVLQMEDAWKMD